MALCSILRAATAAVVLAATATLVQAAPVNYADTYWGGNDGSFNSDVVAASGDTRFNISSMDVERVANNLIVVINTNYSGTNVGTLGTNVGALFIGDPLKLNYNGASAAPIYNDDVFTADKDRFSYVFDYDVTPDNTSPPANQSGNGSLYTLKGDGTDVVLSNAPAGQIRNNQAVDIKDSAKTAQADTGLNGTWAIGVGTITFNISNFFALSGIPSTGLTLAWAMTCANDIILAQVVIPGGNTPEVPLPAGLLLLLSGLTGLGFLARLKSRKASAAS
jgi:hypothetical protein